MSVLYNFFAVFPTRCNQLGTNPVNFDNILFITIEAVEVNVSSCNRNAN